MVERVKGGVKLFIGRLPTEATQQTLQDCFADYGTVLEVFLIDSARSTTGARCAFVRIDSLEHAERAIREMHEQRVLVPERAELGPIQVAFAKGEAQRFGLDPEREQLPARWQIPVKPDAHHIINPGAPVDPDSLSKEALVSLIKEGQRTGGQPFKQQWWGYCDSGKGGVHDYDPKRHSRASLRQFFIAAQQGEWGAKPWFRRAINWALMGGRTGSRPRGMRGLRRRRRRHGGSSSRSTSSSYSSSGSSKTSATSSSTRRKRSLRRNAAAMRRDAAAAAVANMATSAAPAGLAPPPFGKPLGPFGPGQAPPPGPPGAATPPGLASGRPMVSPLTGLSSVAGRPPAPSLGELLRGAQPPPPEGPPPPEPEPRGAAAASSKARLLAPASERDPELESFLAKHRITPATSFLMLRLRRDQARLVMASVSEALQRSEINGLPPSDKDAEEAALSRLKCLGVRTATAGGGSWTSTERTASPVPSRGPTRDAASENGIAGGIDSFGEDGSSPVPERRLGAAGDAAPTPDSSARGGLGGISSTLAGLPSLDGLLGTSLTSSLPKVGSEAEEEDAEFTGDAPVASAESPSRPSPPLAVVGAESRPANTAAEMARAISERTVGRGVAGGAWVFVKNLDKGTGERELRDLFGKHGTVAEVEIPRDKETGLGKGFAFVTLARAEDADRCIRALHFTKPWGRALIVERLRGPGETPEVPQASKAVSEKGGATTTDQNGTEKKEETRRRKKPTGLRKKTPKPQGGSGSSGSSSGTESTSSGSGLSSGWSRYTVGSKGRRQHARKQQKVSKRDRHRMDSRSSSYSSYEEDWSECTSRSRGPPGMGNMAMLMEGMPPMVDQNGMPLMPPPFSVPGLGVPMMPAPWSVPPWAMPPPVLDDNGFPIFDRDEAERQLRHAERQATRRDRDDRRGGDDVWEDHPARLAQRRRSRSRPSRSPSRIPQRERSNSSSRGSRGRRRGSSSRSHGPRRRGGGSGPSGGHCGPCGMGLVPPFTAPPWFLPPPGMPPGVGPLPQQPPVAIRSPGDAPADSGRKRSKSRHRSKNEDVQNVESDDSDVDMVRMEKDIDFADI